MTATVWPCVFPRVSFVVLAILFYLLLHTITNQYCIPLPLGLDFDFDVDDNSLLHSIASDLSFGHKSNSKGSSNSRKKDTHSTALKSSSSRSHSKSPTTGHSYSVGTKVLTGRDSGGGDGDGAVVRRGARKDLERERERDDTTAYSPLKEIQVLQEELEEKEQQIRAALDNAKYYQHLYEVHVEKVHTLEKENELVVAQLQVIIYCVLPPYYWFTLTDLFTTRLLSFCFEITFAAYTLPYTSPGSNPLSLS